MGTSIQQAERTARFMKLLPTGEDEVLVVLKGHLLLEELLVEILNSSLSESNPLGIKVSASNMMFARKLELCWALVGHKSVISEVWSSLKMLNQIRNKMSHHVNPQGISDLIDVFVRDVQSYDPFGLVCCASEYKLESAICCLYVILNEQVAHSPRLY
ncbi:conserved hypothetical protein [Vibrio crassostreae]|nr:hypothetical protein BH582_01420 [Vibrio sp. 10N.222.47.A9]CAK1963716.1 conserved hypothetical protein [Vibrio crassostreae]CAK1972264.1 conserved hypothetical protein [Vibrio crassostreae]CAK1978385.1 conserved hypothetical protein [Vibrio crassostreae]CAK1979271.1 conserved hypothetical protein [Vibrio crassostreae]